MARCWEWEAAERPDFAAIHERVEGLYLAADERGVREAEAAAAAAAQAPPKEIVAEEESPPTDGVTGTVIEGTENSKEEVIMDEARRRRQRQQESRRRRHREHIDGGAAPLGNNNASAVSGDSGSLSTLSSSSNASSSYFSATDSGEESKSGGTPSTRLRPGVTPLAKLETDLLQIRMPTTIVPDKSEVFTLKTMEKRNSIEDLSAGNGISNLRRMWESSEENNINARPAVPAKPLKSSRAARCVTQVKPPSFASLSRARHGGGLLSQMKPHTYAAPSAIRPVATREGLLAMSDNIREALERVSAGDGSPSHRSLFASQMKQVSERVSTLADAFSSHVSRTEESEKSASANGRADGAFEARALLARLRELSGRLTSSEDSERTLSSASLAVTEVARILKRL